MAPIPMLARLLPAILVLLATGVASAREPWQPLPSGRQPFRSYGSDRGLTNLAAIALAQDARGFLWVTTQDGVFRYDGARFTRFGLEHGLPSTNAGGIAAAADGRVWVATWKGLAAWSGERFAAVPETAGLPSGTPNALAVDGASRVWVAHPAGLFRSSAGGSFESVPGWPAGLEAAGIRVRDDLVYASGLGFVARLDGAGRWTWWGTSHGLGAERFDAVAQDGDGWVWARSAEHLLGLGPGASRFVDASHVLPTGSTNGYLALDRRGRLHVPTDGGIVWRHDGRWEVISGAQGLPTEWARDVLEDREGSLWVASLGVHRRLGRGEFTSWARRDGLPNDVVWSFERDVSGHLLVGTDRGLVVSTRAGWTVVPGTERQQVRALARGDDGVYWMGGSPAQVLRYAPRARPADRLRRYPVGGRIVYSILVDRDGAVWAATANGGLLRLAPGSEAFVRADLPEGHPTERFAHVIEDAVGRVWATGDRGLAVRENGTWRRFGARDGLRADHVSFMAESPAGDVWVSYFEPLGLTRVRLAQGGGAPLRALEHISKATGLVSDLAYLVGFDGRGRLWVGSGQGVDVVDGGRVEHIGLGQGLVEEDTDAMAFRFEAPATVFVGTSAGFSRHVSEAALPPPPVPEAVLLAVEVGGQPVGTASTGHVAPYGRPEFAATFAGLSYLDEERLQHEVRLVGLDDDWQPSGREARYSRLPPGDYRFEMRCRLLPGPWSVPAGVSFSVEPAPWQTAGARALGLLLLVGVVALVFRGRVQLLRRRNRELAALVEERTRELAAANQTLTSLSLTDPLTGLRNRRYVDLSMGELAADVLRRHRARPAGGPRQSDLVLLMLDLDRFKSLNDEHGHPAGDHVLRTLHLALRGAIREADSVIRWGGEEFLVLARNTDRDEAPAIAERIRTAVAEHAFVLPDGTPVTVTASLGFAAFPFLDDEPEALGWEDVAQLADAALYVAKRSGRNAWIGLSPAPATRAADLHGRLEHDVPGLAAEGLLLPVTPLDGRVLRWRAS